MLAVNHLITDNETIKVNCHLDDDLDWPRLGGALPIPSVCQPGHPAARLATRTGNDNALYEVINDMLLDLPLVVGRSSEKYGASTFHSVSLRSVG
jgi:hypothetical protein